MNEYSSEAMRNAINFLRSPQFLNVLSAAATPRNYTNENQQETDTDVVNVHSNRDVNRPSVVSDIGSVGAEVRTLFRSPITAALNSNRSQSLNRPFNFVGSGRKRSRSLSARSRPPKLPKEQFPTFIKQVILLPDKSIVNVPRGGIKTTLEKQGFVLYNQELKKAWNEEKFKQEIMTIFEEKLSPNDEIVFLKASGTSLIIPKISPGVQLTGDVVNRIWGKGILYVRRRKDLDDSDSESGSLEDILTDDELPIVLTNGNSISTTDTPTNGNQDQIPTVVALRNSIDVDVSSTHSSLCTLNESENIQHISNVQATTSGLNHNNSYDQEVYADYVSLSGYEPASDIEDNISLDIPEPISLDTPLTLKSIISKLTSKLDLGKVNEINVIRSNVMDGAFRAFKRKSFNAKAKMCIVFTDDFQQREDGLDLGGPSREFFRLLLKQVMESTVFEGPEIARNIAMHQTAVRDNMYYLAGLAIALSIVHGGPGPCSLSEPFYDCLYKDPCNVKVNPNCIADIDLRDRVLRVSNSTNLEELDSALENISDIMLVAGINSDVVELSQKDNLVNEVMNFLVVRRHFSNLEKFKEGLATLGVLNEIRNFPELFKPIVVRDEVVVLTRKKLNSLFTIKYSEPGGNRFTAENVTISFWRDFLIDVEEGDAQVTLEDILIFATGANIEPPLGFSPDPVIGFLHENVIGSESPSKYPMANACGLCLNLPIVHTLFKDFKEYMAEGIILGNTCFGKA